MSIDPQPFISPRRDGHGAVVKGYLNFRIETCGVCGCEIMATNAIGVYATRALLARMGVTYRPAAPPEGCWSESLQKVTCPRCYEE